jgi:excisionase family DNA binding protein
MSYRHIRLCGFRRLGYARSSRRCNLMNLQSRIGIMVSAVTTRQAAQALGVSEASLKRWCDQGLLPSVRTPGGHRRLPLDGVVQFIRERRLALVRPSLLGLPAEPERTADDGQTALAQMRTALVVAS